MIICARISKRWSRYIQCVLRQQLKHKKTCKLFILSGTFSSGGALSCNCSFSVLQMHFSPFTSSRCVFNKNYISHNIHTWPQAHLTFDCCMCEMIKHMGRKRILAFFFCITMTQVWKSWQLVQLLKFQGSNLFTAKPCPVSFLCWT